MPGSGGQVLQQGESSSQLLLQGTQGGVLGPKFGSRRLGLRVWGFCV